MINVGIIGATGYAGTELVRLIYAHPQAQISAISSVSFQGQKISEVYPSYIYLNDMICETAEEVIAKSDVIFAALPHGLSQELAADCKKAGKAIIDLGADFRLESEEEYQEWYGGTFLDKDLHFSEIISKEKPLLLIRVVTQLVHLLQLLRQLLMVWWNLRVLFATVKAV